MLRPLSYLKAVVICHGKSEKQMCEFLKSNLRIRIAIESDKKGEKSIQITSVMKMLNGRKFKTLQSFMQTFDDVESFSPKRLSDDFKIFIIMDTDDCSDLQKKDFKSKEMFKKHWAYQYIVPIYNDPELESVLVKSNIKFEKKGDERKKEYIKIFPTDIKYIKNEMVQIEDFYKNLKKNKNTNLDVFIEFCLRIAD